MKRFLARAALATFVSTSSLVSAAFADEPKPVSQVPKATERPKAEPAAPNADMVRALVLTAPYFPQSFGKAGAAAYIEQTDKIAKLTTEQKQKIEGLFEVRELEMRALQAVIAAKSQSLAQDMSRAVQLKDQELIAKVQKSYQELYSPLNEQAKKSEAALDAILTAEQKAKLQAAKAAAPKQAGAAAGNPTNLGFLGGKALFTFAQPLDQAEFQKKQQEFEKRMREQGAEHRKLTHEHQAEIQRRMATMLPGPNSPQHAAHHDALRDRVRRQRELTKKSAKIVKKLDELDSRESPKARDLWKQLEQVQAELQQTLGGPQAFSISTMPSQPAGAWVVHADPGNGGPAMNSSGTINSGSFGGLGGAIAVGSGTAGPGGIVISSTGQAQPNPTTLRVGTVHVTPQPNNIPQPATAEILKAIETLRRQVEELQSQVRKLSEKK